jgi:hypothetical protein
VLRPEGEGLQDQEIQGAFEEVGPAVGVCGIFSVFSAGKGTAVSFV